MQRWKLFIFIEFQIDKDKDRMWRMKNDAITWILPIYGGKNCFRLLRLFSSDYCNAMTAQKKSSQKDYVVLSFKLTLTKEDICFFFVKFFVLFLRLFLKFKAKLLPFDNTNLLKQSMDWDNEKKHNCFSFYNCCDISKS